MSCLLRNHYCETPIIKNGIDRSIHIAGFDAYDRDLVQMLYADPSAESRKALVIGACEHEHSLDDDWEGPVGPSSGARFEHELGEVHERRDSVHISHSVYPHVDDKPMMTSDLVIICGRKVIVSGLFTPWGSPN